MMETMDYIKKLKNNDTLWVFKPHPSCSRYGEDGILERKIKELNISNLVVYPKHINLRSFLECCDLLITGRGNIAIEAAGLGTNVLVAGKNYYQNLGLVNEPKTKKEYFKIIKELKNKRLPKNMINKARKVMYIMDNIQPKTIKSGSIIPEKKPSDYYVASKSYFNNLNKNLRNKSFVNDLYYFHLKKILIQSLKPRK